MRIFEICGSLMHSCASPMEDIGYEVPSVPCVVKKPIK